tara:strand:+ start:32536 stop:33447 length:912 start_codon:yes stop_codon:yes gene_type:complete
MVVHTLQEAHKCLEGKQFAFAPPKENENTGGKTSYFRDYSTNGRGKKPQVLFNKMCKQPFELHCGKNKPVDLKGFVNLELSLNTAEHAEEIAYFQAYDAFVREKLKSDESFYGRPLNDTEIKFLHRASLEPDKKVPGRFLLRLKVSKSTTTIYVVCEKTDNNITKYKKGTLLDLQPGSFHIPLIEHVYLYTGSKQFGCTHGGVKLLVFPSAMMKDHTPQEEEQEEEDQFPFGEGFELVQEEKAEEGEASSSSTSVQNNLDTGHNGISEGPPQMKRSRTEAPKSATAMRDVISGEKPLSPLPFE